MRKLLTSFIVVVALAGCAAEDSTATTGDATTPPTTVTTATTATDSTASATITIENFSFGEPVEVSEGATVTVVNQDGATHTWTSDDGAFDSGNLGSGERFSHAFEESGRYGFFCEIHPGMTGTVTVTG